MTEFRQENGQIRITKGCKQQTACDVQAQSNRTLCYEYPYVRVCHSCCEGDFCNDDMELPPFRNGKCLFRSKRTAGLNQEWLLHKETFLAVIEATSFSSKKASFNQNKRIMEFCVIPVKSNATIDHLRPPGSHSNIYPLTNISFKMEFVENQLSNHYLQNSAPLEINSEQRLVHVDFEDLFS